jgi:hypothetical protein
MELTSCPNFVSGSVWYDYAVSHPSILIGKEITVSLVGGFVLNSLIATIGVAISEGPFYHAFNPRTYKGMYLKEITLSAGIAFLLGCFIYLKWRVPASQWVWIIGICTFGWQLTTGNRPGIEGDFLSSTLAFVSIRFVFYSLGAISCSWIRSAYKASPSAASSN